MPQLIPRTFHFVFGLKPQPKPLHLMHYLCLESCIQVNRPDCVNLYYRHLPWGPYWDRIAPKLRLHPVEGIRALQNFEYSDPAVGHYRYAHESDFIRLEQLVRQGGVYADMDTLFVNPLPDHLFEKPFVLGREQEFLPRPGAAPEPSLCNALIMSEPESKFGRAWLESSYAVFDGSWSTHSCQLPQTLSTRHPDWIHIEPPRSFYKHLCTVPGIRTLFEGCDPDFDGVFSMHLWHHMWAQWWRRDHTRFRESDLTEDYVRSFPSTYSVAARRFLPGEAPEIVPAPRRPVSATVHPFDHWITHLGLRILSSLPRRLPTPSRPLRTDVQ